MDALTQGAIIVGMSGRPRNLLKQPKFRHWNLKEWREHRGLTQEQLANRVDMSIPSISRLETGQQPYSQPVLEALADALDCEPSDLVMRLPPGRAQFDLWEVVKGLTEAQSEQALRVLKALTEAA